MVGIIISEDECLVFLLVYFMASIPITIWILLTLARARSTQEEIGRRLDTIDEKLKCSARHAQDA